MAAQAPALPRQPRTSRNSLVAPSPRPQVNEDGRETPKTRPLSLQTTAPSKFYDWAFTPGSRDQLENTLRSQARENARIRSFLKDYARLKNTQGREVFDGLLRYWIFNSSSSVQSLYSTGRVLEPSQSTKPSFSKFIDGLRIALRSGETGCLKLCLVAETLPTDTKYKLYSLGARMVVPLDRLYRCPTRAMLYTIMQEWGEIQAAQAWIDPKESAWATRLIRLPSSDTVRKPFDVSASEATYEFKWFSQAPHYGTDFYEYVWQRQNKPPAFSAASVEVQTTVQGSKNVFVVLSSPVYGSTGAEILARFEQAHKDLCPARQSSCSGEERFLVIILSILDLMIQDTNKFANMLAQEIGRLIPVGRQNPSGSKLHFLSHLEDYRKYSITSLQSSITILEDIINEIKNHSRVSQDLLLPASKTKEDICYLEAELSMMEMDMQQLYAMLKDKLELRQIRRTYILTFLAAIYLPFSFMTSLYGMNLQDPLWDSSDSAHPPSADASKNLEKRTDNTNNTSIFSETDVSNIISAIKNSGAHLWTLKSYWYTAIPVTVATILLPVILGRLLRLSSQFVFPYIRHWPILLGLVAIAGSLLTLTNRIAFTVYLSAAASVFFILAVWRRKHRRFWAIYAAGSSLCIGLTWQAQTETASLTSVPVLIFLILYLVIGFLWYKAKLSVELLLQNLFGQRAPEENDQAVAEEGGLAQTRSLNLERGPSVRVRKRARSR